MKLNEIILDEYSTSTSAQYKDVKSDKLNVAKLFEILTHWMKEFKGNSIYDGYSHKGSELLKKISTIPYSSEDITSLCFEMQKIRDEIGFTHTGNFLSALMNHHQERTGQEEKYVLILEELPPLDYVCHEIINSTVHVFGNVRNFFCQEIKNCHVELFGSAEDYACRYMKKGTVSITGSAGTFCGEYMHDGTMSIEKNAGKRLGQMMHNGYILVKGNCEESLGYNNLGGTIVILGNVGIKAGIDMRDGIIVVKGNAAEYLGHSMYGGMIIVEGDAGRNLGSGAKDGTILVDGNIESIGIPDAYQQLCDDGIRFRYEEPRIKIIEKGKRVVLKREKKE